MSVWVEELERVSEMTLRGGLVLFMVASVFGQTRVQFSQIRNLAQISPAPVAVAMGGTQLSLSQLRWPGGWYDVGTIVDMIAQVNTGRVFSYSFQGAKVFEYNRAVDFNSLLGKLTPKNADHPDVFDSQWNPLFTADSLEWFRMAALYSSGDLPVLPK